MVATNNNDSVVQNEGNVPVEMWSDAETDTFQVRGKSFLSDGKKVAAKAASFRLVAVDVFSFDQEGDEYNIGGCPSSSVYGSNEFTLIINFIVPGSEKVALVFYFQPIENIEKDELFQSFINGDDTFRNSRFKMIPKLMEGNIMLKAAVGSRPILIGKKLDVKYSSGENYFEIDNDLSTDWMASKVVGMLRDVVESLVLQVAFLIQAETPHHLPEQILGAVQLTNVSVKEPIRIPPRM